jgi:chromosome segregation ATPase
MANGKTKARRKARYMNDELSRLESEKKRLKIQVEKLEAQVVELLRRKRNITSEIGGLIGGLGDIAHKFKEQYLKSNKELLGPLDGDPDREEEE